MVLLILEIFGQPPINNVEINFNSNHPYGFLREVLTFKEHDTVNEKTQ